MANSEAWVTLATNDSYCLGALVLGTSLRRVGTTRDLVVLVTTAVSPVMRTALETVFNLVQEVNVLDSGDTANLQLLTRPDLGITFTKLNCWKLVQYAKCVFLDADTLVIQACDELFEREEFSAAPDSGWPDCFNSGVFVFRPSLETYDRLVSFALEQGSFDGGDQGLLNSFFSDWATTDIKKHLPFIYNMVASAVYSYLPAYKVFGQNVKIAHFIGPSKPWLQFMDTVTGTVHPSPGQENVRDLLQAWWDIFKSEVHQKLVPEMGEEPNATVLEQVQNLSYQSMDPFPYYSPNPTFEYEEPLDLDNLNIAIRRHPPIYASAPPPVSHTEPYPTQTLYSEPLQPRYQDSPTHTPQPHHQTHTPQPHHQTHTPQPHHQTHTPQPHHQTHTPQPHHQTHTPQPHHQTHTPQPHHQTHSHLESHEFHQPSGSQSHEAQQQSREEAAHFREDFHQNPFETSPMPVRCATEQCFLNSDSPLPQSPSYSCSELAQRSTPSHCCSQVPPSPLTVQTPSDKSEAMLARNSQDNSVPMAAEHPVATGIKGLAGVFAQMSLEGSKSAEQLEHESIMRKHAWEEGQIDFMGKDSFDNIFKKIQASMAQASLDRSKKERTPEKVKERSPPKTGPQVEQPPEVVATTPGVQPAAVDATVAVNAITPGTQPVAVDATTAGTQPTSVNATTPGTQPISADASTSATQTDTAALVPPPTNVPEDKTQASGGPVVCPESKAACDRQVKQEATQAEVEGRVPVQEPIVIQTHTSEPCVCHPHKPTGETVDTPSAELSLDELEDEILAVERAALEKKLAEQKKVAEQKLITELAAAEAAAVKKQEAIAAEAAISEQVSSPVTPTAVPELPPVEPVKQEVCEIKTEEVKSGPVEASATAPPPTPVSEAVPVESKPIAVPQTKDEIPAAAVPAKELKQVPIKTETQVAPAPTVEVPKAPAKPEVKPPVVESKQEAPIVMPPEAPIKADVPAAAAAAPTKSSGLPVKKEAAGASASGAGGGKAQEPKAPPRKQAAKAWSIASLTTTGIMIAGISLGTMLFLRR